MLGNSALMVESLGREILRPGSTAPSPASQTTFAPDPALDRLVGRYALEEPHRDANFAAGEIVDITRTADGLAVSMPRYPTTNLMRWQWRIRHRRLLCALRVRARSRAGRIVAPYLPVCQADRRHFVRVATTVLPLIVRDNDGPARAWRELVAHRETFDAEYAFAQTHQIGRRISRHEDSESRCGTGDVDDFAGSEVGIPMRLLKSIPSYQTVQRGFRRESRL